MVQMPAVQPRALMKAKTHYIQDKGSLRSLLEPAPAVARPPGGKVIVTLGPATHDVDTLCDLLNEGMSCARIDLKVGTPEYHAQSLALLDAARARTGRTCPVMVDTVGRELTIQRACTPGADGWPVPRCDIEIKAGQHVTLTTDGSAEASSSQLPVSFSGLPGLVQAGDRFFVGTYLNTGSDASSLLLEVVNVGAAEVDCVAKGAATLTGMLTLAHTTERGGGLSAVQSELPLLSESDGAAVQLLMRAGHKVDYVAVSYARGGEDLLEMRTFLDKAGLHNTKMICKLEDRASLCNFQSLAAAADGIIFARGHLGLQIPPEKMAMVQKHVVGACNQLGKPVIVTRIVDTMVHTPRPTRAEATDVANIILDGADGLLLGAETLRGKYPAITVRTVLDICREAEAAFDSAQHYEVLIGELVKLDGRMRRGQGSEGDLAGLASPQGSAGNLSTFGTMGASELGNSTLGRTSSADLTKLGANASSFGSIPKSLSRLALSAAAGDDEPSAASDDAVPAGGHVSNLSPYKLEALTSSAVRAVSKVQARLLICFGSTGRTASLLAKYRPPVPILTVVMHKAWAGDAQHAEYLSRQLELVRGVIPVLAHPEAEENQEMMQWAVQQAVARKLVSAGDQIVCIMAMKDTMVLKMIAVDAAGSGPMKAAQSSALLHTDSDLAHELCKLGSLP